jgi:hypothetical protein
MVETITPAGCGSRHRYRVALALFSVGAIGAAAALGALLGLAGASLDRSWTVPVLAVLALLAGLREWGVLRVPLPGAHRQVPERWRRERPLGAWSLAYGAGLGTGILTHQVVASFWVACAGAIAVADPGWSAACLAPFGAGRALMVALPARGGRDPSVAVGRLARRARLLRPANAVVLVALAAVLAATPAIAQAATPQGRFDPAVAGKVLALTELDPSGSTVLVRAPGRPDVRVPGSRSPALDFDLLAYTDAAGINVIRWTTGEPIGRVPGDVDQAAIDWPRIAYVRRTGSGERLEMLNLVSGHRVTLSRAGPLVDIGRPALRDGYVAWHRASGQGSEVRVRRVRGGRSIVVSASRSGLVVNPALSSGRILWVEQFGQTSYLRLRRVRSGKVRTLATLPRSSSILWTTALGPHTAFVTRWNPTTARARVIHRLWRR